MQCTAKSKQSGEQCKRHAVPGKQVCVIHGGKSRSGTAHPNFKHGIYMQRDKNLSTLGQMVEKHLTGDDPVALREEMALLRARIEQLFSYADDAPDRKVSVDLVRRAYDAIAKGIADTDAGALLQGRSFLAAALEKLNAEQEAWAEIRANIATLQRLSSTEIARDKIQQDHVHSRDLTLLFANLQQVILDTVPEADRRRAIQEGFRAALMEHRLLTPGG